MPGSHRFHFKAEQWLPYPVEVVFAFFGDPHNLPRLMPSWQKARIENASYAPPPPQPSEISALPSLIAGGGTRLTLTVRPFPLSPIRMSWDALIEDFRWNEGFCDVQLRGPFRYWRQCHNMHPAKAPKTGAAGTLLRDEIEYELPLSGPLARVANLMIKPQIAVIFRYRHKRTTELLGKL